MTSLSDLLASSGKVPGAFSKDSPVGTTVQGVIDDANVRQVNSFETGEPEFWSDGNPKLQVAIILQTDQRDPMDPEDDGRRGVYVKWWGESRKELERAIKAAGDTDLRKGGLFMAKYAGEKPNDNPRLNSTKLYAYAYQVPAQTAGLNLAGDQVNTQTGEITQPPAPVAAAPAPVAAPQPAMTFPAASPAAVAAQPPMGTTDAAQEALARQLGATPVAVPAPAAAAPAAPAAGGIDMDKVKQFIGLGLSDADIAGATGAPLEVVAAVRNLP